MELDLREMPIEEAASEYSNHEKFFNLILNCSKKNYQYVQQMPNHALFLTDEKLFFLHLKSKEQNVILETIGRGLMETNAKQVAVVIEGNEKETDQDVLVVHIYGINGIENSHIIVMRRNNLGYVNELVVDGDENQSIKIKNHRRSNLEKD